MKAELETCARIFQNIRTVIIGKDEQIKQCLYCWLAGGHVLIEDVPGTGKTMLARALAKSVSLPFKRIQFTPDLLPSDIVGATVYQQKEEKFRFNPGPLFSTLVLADEINRATPRTQSALLESMAEKQITVEGHSFQMPELFFVIATQNPIENHGTFPLPEAQLDRFMMKISLGYPTLEEEIHLVKAQNKKHPIDNLTAVATTEELLRLKALVSEIKVSDAIYKYAAQIVSRTRDNLDLKLGAGPRALITLIRLGQAAALVGGLDHVRPHHISSLVPAVLGHRVYPNTEARLAGKKPAALLDEILKNIHVPVQ